MKRPVRQVVIGRFGVPRWEPRTVRTTCRLGLLKSNYAVVKENVSLPTGVLGQSQPQCRHQWMTSSNGWLAMSGTPSQLAPILAALAVHNRHMRSSRVPSRIQVTVPVTNIHCLRYTGRTAVEECLVRVNHAAGQMPTLSPWRGRSGGRRRFRHHGRQLFCWSVGSWTLQGDSRCGCSPDVAPFAVAAESHIFEVKDFGCRVPRLTQ
jgi:hypothetical protein